MIADIINYTYIFLEGVFWGYTFFVLLLIILFFGSKHEAIRYEALNWLSALNISFILAIIANSINFTLVLLFENTGENFQHKSNSLFSLLAIVFSVFRGALAILFFLKKFRIQWSLSIVAVLLINWYKIYYLLEGTYDQWLSYRPYMPGRSWYPVIFVITLFLSYIFLIASRQTPHTPYWQKWKRRIKDV
jgi:hypothetical protein